MGGKLEVLSELGVGTTFTFALDLPVISLADAQNTIEFTHIVPSIQNQPFTTAKILVVEDNETNSIIINKSLTQIGHTVQLADTGEKALD